MPERYPNISDHGLFGGLQLGNFSQAFTHLSLINALITLNRELDQRTYWAEPALASA